MITTTYPQESLTASANFLSEYSSYLQIERSFCGDSISAYRGDLLKMFSWMSERALDCVAATSEDLSSFIIDMEKVSASTSLIRMVSAVKSFYDFLEKDGHIESSPARYLVKPAKDDIEPEYLTSEEMRSLLEQPDEISFEGIRDRAILHLFYSSGLRVTELISLSAADVDLRSRRLTCTGKGSKQRIVPIGKAAIDAIQTYLELKDECDLNNSYLFVTGQGSRINRQYVYEIVQRYALRAGLDGVSPHTLRHSFATELLRGGAPVTAVQRLLGHSSLSSTQIYTHVTRASIRRTYELRHPRAQLSGGKEVVCEFN